MKNAIRLLSLLLAGILLLGLVACKTDSGNETPTATETPTDTESDSPYADRPDIPTDLDYSGMEFRILARNASDYYSDELWVSEENTKTQVNSAVYGRYKKIEEQYGVTFKLDTRFDENEIQQWVTTAARVADASDVYHLVATHGTRCPVYAVEGFSADWNRLPYVNVGSDWWSQDAQAQWTTLSGSIYMMTGDISYLSVGQAVGQFFNKDLLRSVGLDNPYQLVRDGEWTYENFKLYVAQLSESLTGDDSKNIATDSGAYVTGWWRGPINVIYSAGARWLEVGEDDIKVVGATDHNLTAVFDEYFAMLKSNTIIIQGNYADAWEAFNTKRVGFYDDITLCAKEFSKAGTSFGLLPMPKASKTVEKNYTFANAATNTFMVPVAVLSDEKTTEMTSVVLELLAYYGSKDVLPTYYKEVLTTGSQTDVESVEMMGIIRNSLVYDLGYYYSIGGLSGIGHEMAEELLNKKYGEIGSFATKYTRYADQVSKYLNDWKALD